MLDSTWVEETARFIEEAVRSEGDAAVFRRAVSARTSFPALREAFGLAVFAVFGRAAPDQGLVISHRRYDALGGHREGAADPEADLLARLGRVLLLRSGVRSP